MNKLKSRSWNLLQLIRRGTLVVLVALLGLAGLSSQGEAQTPPAVQSITLVGTPAATATSVQYLMTFDESARNITADDFELTSSGVFGDISSVSASSGTSVTVTVGVAGGVGTLRLDLKSGTDIEDAAGNSGVAPFTSGAVHTVNLPLSIRLGGALFQGIPLNGDFPAQIFAIVEDGGGNRVAGIPVTFSAPTTGPSLIFLASGSNTLSRTTNVNGTVSSATMRPATAVGNFQLTARIDGTSISVSTTYTNEPTDLAPPNINASTIVGSPAGTATEVTFEKDFDEVLRNLTIDDFELVLTGTAAGTITGFTQPNTRSARITVSSISGSGSVAVRLKAITDVTDRIDNGNNNNGYATQTVTSAVHTVDFAPPAVQSISLVGTPAADIGTVQYTVTFDENARQITADDFTVTTTGGAQGTVTSLSSQLGTSVTVTVGNINGNGTLRLDLNSGTNIIDNHGNGNGTNGTAAPFTSGDVYTSEGRPEIRVSLASEQQSGDTSNFGNIPTFAIPNLTIRNIGLLDLTYQITVENESHPGEVTARSTSPTSGTVTPAGSQVISFFIAPSVFNSVPRSFRFRITNNDSDENPFILNGTYTTNNVLPESDAGPDQSALSGATVTLDGSGSSDSNGGDAPVNTRQALTYRWSQVSGPSVTLSSTSAERPTFTAPALSAPATLRFQLVVNDGIADDPTPDTVDITVSPPRIASIDRLFGASTTVSLDEIHWRIIFSEAGMQNVSLDDFQVSGTTAALSIRTAPTDSSGTTLIDLTLSGGDLADLNGVVTLSLRLPSDITNAGGASILNGVPTGLDESTITFQNDPADFFVQADGTSTDAINNVPVTNGQTTISAAAGTDFGTVEAGQESDRFSFDYGNRSRFGTLEFLGSQATITGAHASDFRFPGTLSDRTLTGSSSSGFAIQFSPTGTGLRQAVVTLRTNDPDDDPFTFAIAGTGTADVTRPVVSVGAAPGTPNPATAPFDVFFSFREAISGFVLADIMVTNGAASNLIPSGTGRDFFRATITPEATGPVVITLPENAVRDDSGNLSVAGAATVQYSDVTPPTATSIVRQTPSGTLTNADTLVFRVTFGEAVQNVDVNDFAPSGTTATATSIAPVSGTTYDVTLSGGDLASFNGTVGLDFASAQNITDLSGTAFAGTEPTADETYTLDNMVPTLTSLVLTTPSASPGSVAAATFTATFSRAVENVSSDDFILTGGGALGTIVASGGGTPASMWTITVTGIADGETAALGIAGSPTITDAVGNAFTGSSLNASYRRAVPGITVTAGAGLTTTEAGGTATFTIVLDSQPSANVTIGLTSSDTGEGTVSPASVVFTPANWNAAQTVTVTGQDDTTADGAQSYNIITAVATSADTDYNVINPADVAVSNTDDDAAGITVTAGAGLTTTEAGGTATFTIVLDSQPSANVTIGLTSSDTGEGTVSPASVVFTPANWNAAQTVTVTGQDDTTADGAQSYNIITAVATSADTDYNVINPADVAVSNTDDDAAGITVTAGAGLTTTEAGGTATFTIVLDSQPSANVTIGLTSSDTGEGTVSPASVVFTPANWNAAQTVTVTGQDDTTADGAQSYNIITAVATSADTDYNVINPADVAVSNTDDDAAGITVTAGAGLTTTEAGGTATFTLVLDSQPSANVTIGLTSSDTGEGTVSPASVVFTPANWNAAQTVTVTGQDDTTADGAQSYNIITAVATSADTDYNVINPADVAVSNTDDDAAGITVTAGAGLTTTEAGGTATFTLVLDSQPSANVTIGLTSSDTGEGTVSPASVVFTPANWNAAQTVTVTGQDDTTADGAQSYNIITAVATSADADYNVINPADVAVSNTDDDAVFTAVPTTEETQAVILGFLQSRAKHIQATNLNFIELLDGDFGNGGGPLGNFQGEGTAEEFAINFATSWSSIFAERDAWEASRLALSSSEESSGNHENRRLDFWAQIHGSKGRDDNTKSTLWAGYFGVHAFVTPDLIIGGLAQLDWSEETNNTANSRTEGSGWMVGPYLVGRLLEQSLTFEARAAWGQSSNEVSPDGTFTDEFDTERFLVAGKVAGAYEQDYFTLKPNATLSWYREIQESYTDNFGRAIPEQTISVGQLRFGPEFIGKASAYGDFLVEPSLGFSGVWDFDISSGSAPQNLTNSENRLHARLDVGLRAGVIGSATTLSLKAFLDGIGAANYETTGASFEVERRF